MSGCRYHTAVIVRHTHIHTPHIRMMVQYKPIRAVSHMHTHTKSQTLREHSTHKQVGKCHQQNQRSVPNTSNSILGLHATSLQYYRVFKKQDNVSSFPRALEACSLPRAWTWWCHSYIKTTRLTKCTSDCGATLHVNQKPYLVWVDGNQNASSVGLQKKEQDNENQYQLGCSNPTRKTEKHDIHVGGSIRIDMPCMHTLSVAWGQSPRNYSHLRGHAAGS